MNDEDRQKVLDAKAFAKMAHIDQRRDDGKPYWLHLSDVAELVSVVAPGDANLICAAWLHDTIEDTPLTPSDLVEGFGDDVTRLVMEVTHEGEKDHYGRYFPRLHSKRGIMLKFADRLSNIADMESWSKDRQEHYLRKSQFWKDGSDR